MRRFITTLTLFAFAMVSLSQVRSQEPSSDLTAEALKPGGDNDPDRGIKQFLGLRALGGKKIDPDAYSRGMGQWRKLPRSALRRRGPKAGGTEVFDATLGLAAVSGVDGTVWVPIGPSPMHSGDDEVNGRVHAIAVNPFNRKVIYQGLNIGGVWRSIDEGATWEPLMDQQPAMGIGQPASIAIDPSNTDIIYVGMNNRFQVSAGIMKSADGGGSWIVLGSGFPANNVGNAYTLFSTQNVNAVVVEPSNGNILYAASGVGLFRSTDGGRNWTMGVNGAGNAQALVLDPTSPAANRILYAGVNGSGLRMSTDGGQNWTQILNSATPAVTAALNGGNFGRVNVALAPPTAPPNAAGIQVIYVTMSGAGGGAPDPVGIFQSTDQGVNWTQRVASILAFTNLVSRTQGGFNLELGVDPASPGDGVSDILYIGCVRAGRSADAGANFAAVGPMHVDSRAGWEFVRRPGLPSIVYTGNDGGMYRSTNNGVAWSGAAAGPPDTINAGGLQTAMIYHMDIQRDAAATKTLISLQDNGSAQSGVIPDWTIRTGGDGFDVVFDVQSTADAYEVHNISGSSNGVFRSTNNGDSFSAITDGITNDLVIFATTGANVVNVDPQNAGHLYVSGSAGGLWLAKDADTGAPPTFNKIQSLSAPLGAVDVAPANSNYVVCVAGNTRVFVSTNSLVASPSFFEVTGNLPGRTVMQVAFDPNDPSAVYATLSGFNNQTPAQPGHIFRRSIFSGNWTNISPALDVPFDAIAIDGTPAPSTIYVGSDLGVLRSTDRGQTWTVLDDAHFPNIPVTDIKINTQARVLQASTFGRGMFEFAFPDGPIVAVNAQNGLAFGSVCVGATNCLTIQVFNVGNSNLVINSVQRILGSSAFHVLAGPATPLIISPNAEVDFTVCYSPSSTATNEQATIRVASSDPNAPYYDLTATGAGTTPMMATVIANGGRFGNVCMGTYKDLDLTINNSGGCDLVVTNITSDNPEFQVPLVQGFPLLVQAGTSIRVPIRLEPTSLGMKSANIRVMAKSATGSLGLVNTFAVSGNTPPGSLRLTGSTDFGDVCADTLAEKQLAVCNVGTCNLNVSSAMFVPPCPDFELINNPFPAAVSPDSCEDLTIRFTPTSCGQKSCTLRIITDDPNALTNDVTVTANTPCPMIDVPPDQCFPPTVIQSVGACSSLKPFPISNTGTCPLTITAITLGGANPNAYFLSGLPSFPIILEQGHVVGEGNFNIGFAPLLLARDTLATISVSYLSDPAAGVTTTVTRVLNGEGVRTGARVLVLVNGSVADNVEKLQIQRINANRNKNLLDTVETIQDLPPVTFAPAAPCPAFTYHREYSTVDNPIQLLPGSYQITATAKVDGKRKSKTIGFDVQTCTFNPNIVISLP
jgi:hypothetical protein